MLDKQIFLDKYPALSGTIGGSFGDAENCDDDLNARETRTDLSAADRIELLKEILAEAHRLMTNIDEDWEGVAWTVNRQQLNSRDQVRDWFLRVMVIWQEELSRLQNGGSRE